FDLRNAPHEQSRLHAPYVNNPGYVLHSVVIALVNQVASRREPADGHPGRHETNPSPELQNN
ncbi:MAG: hypothetical protein WD070_06890, partial [Pirellulaceae bacterium]